MIEFVTGEVVDLTPTSVVLVNGGLGYLLQISMQTYAQLEGKATALLYVHEVLREDAHELYGFFSKQERTLFKLLISVSGVGPNTGRVLLSAHDVEELVDIISRGDDSRLCRAKGVGTKTAQRIIVDLQGKIPDLIPTGGKGGALGTVHNTTRDDALFALIALGFQKSATEKVVDALIKSGEHFSVEQLIKAALQQL